MLQAFLQGLKELAFPNNCLLCRTFLNSRYQQQLCASCASQITPNSPFVRQKKNFAFDQAWAACLYNDPFQKLLHAFKYGGKTRLHKTFIPLMINFVETHHVPVQRFDVVMPIPLHPARLRERSFNQAEILSLKLSQHYHLRHDAGNLIRQRATPTQTALEAKQRWTNLKDAFKINHPDALAGKSVLLVDDLFTTGATVNAAAAALKEAGAAYVGVLTLAITI